MSCNAIYIFKVSKNFVRRFLKIQNEAVKIYKRHGAIESKIFLEKSSVISLRKILRTKKNDLVFIGIDTFRNKREYLRSMKKIDSDKRINELYNELKRIIKVREIIRGEFEER